MDRIGLGVIGLGGFARFALQHFTQVPGVEVVAVGGVTSDEAKHCAARYGAPVLDSIEAVCGRDDVDWVYINTPPFLHAAQAMVAIEAGKHVLVEKPLATSIEDADRMIAAADRKGVRIVTNLMQRYNPLVSTLKSILGEGLIGEPLFFNLNNHAVDQGLPSSHWFWDRDKSGGIFVEHGVHFFDLAAHLLGPGRITGAGARRRESDGAEDQVWCDAMFGSAVARFYHGFNQMSAIESQRWEIVCERGQIIMEGWIPLGATVTAGADEPTTRRLMQLVPSGRCSVVEQFPPDRRDVRGHGKMHDVWQSIRLEIPPPGPKAEVYGNLLHDLFAQQTGRGSAGRLLDSGDGHESLRLAVKAREIADAA